MAMYLVEPVKLMKRNTFHPFLQICPNLTYQPFQFIIWVSLSSSFIIADDFSDSQKMGASPQPPVQFLHEGGEIIYRSKLPDIDIPDHLPLHSFCFEKLPDVEDRPCLIDAVTSRTYTYADVELISRRVAVGLHRLGVRQGDVIMLLLPNSTEFVFGFFAASYLGAISTTANPFYTPAEVFKQARTSGASVIITQSRTLHKVESLAEQHGVKIVCIDDEAPEECLKFSDLVGSDETLLPDVDIHPDDVVALPYSSGTTGLPKGVMLTHRSLVTSVSQQVDGENPNLYLHEGDVFVCVLPLFHIFSLNSVLLCALRAGITLLIVPKFEVEPMLGLIQSYKVTIAAFVPPIVLAIVGCKAVSNYDLSSIRIILSGAAPMGKEVEESLQAIMPTAKLGQGYGMTEAGPVLSMCLNFAKHPLPTKSGSCGCVVRNASLKILDTETGVTLPRNQPGEICIRGSQIMKGYLNDPVATSTTVDKEGWLHTGDIGYIDDDDEIFIVDRLKELIKYKGFQVAPAEIEGLLLRHPKVADAAVVPMKDDLAGEVPVAFIVRSSGSDVTEDDLKKYISNQVVFYKRISRVFFVESIPKSPSGKILRKKLREVLAAGIE